MPQPPDPAHEPPDRGQTLLRTVMLTDHPLGPRMRLCRHEPAGEFAIAFDEWPLGAYRTALRAAGFRRRPGEYTWVKPIDPAGPRRSALEAERLFDRIARSIREDFGLPPAPGLPD